MGPGLEDAFFDVEHVIRLHSVGQLGLDLLHAAIGQFAVQAQALEQVELFALLVPPAPALASSGNLGTRLNVYA